MEIIQHTITGKLEEIFKSHFPHLETKDFFELEIASGGIMRGFMTVPCDMYFTTDCKVKRFLETTFKLYDVPQEKIQETVDFVSEFDFEVIAKKEVSDMFAMIANTHMLMITLMPSVMIGVNGQPMQTAKLIQEYAREKVVQQRKPAATNGANGNITKTERFSATA